MSTPRLDARIRIAFGIDNLQIGGTELNAVRLAERLDRSRFDLRVVSMQAEGPLAERYARAGVPIDVFSPGTLFGPGALREGRRLRRYLRQHRIEIVHAHDLYTNVFACPWARLAGAKAIASRRWTGGPQPGWGWAIASRIPYHIAHVSVANSERVAEMLRASDRVPRRRIVVIPNFLDEEAFSPLPEERRHALIEELGLALATGVVGIVANLRPVKDQATLLRAIAMLRPRWPGVRVVLVGDGESRQALRRLAEELDISREIVFAGHRPQFPNLNFLFDISVLCSRKEGFPNAVLEGMAAARPVVATDVGGVRDAVTDGENGLVVPSGDVGRLAAALDALLANPARARDMGAKGRERALTAYSPRAALGALERLYFRLAGRAASGHPAPDASRPIEAVLG